MEPQRHTAEKTCSNCGVQNVAEANFCLSCGSAELTTTSTAASEPTPDHAEEAHGDTAVWLSMPRVIGMTVVTAGLYLFYWFYITWRQLQSETKDIHYPFWHALTLFLPPYGLFRLHRHTKVVQELASNAGVETSLTPSLVVVLLALNWVLALASARVDSVAAALATELTSLALVITVVAWPQAALNSYWTKVRGDVLQEVPIGLVEKTLALVGILIWLNLVVTF